jgi:hypothetical protein
VLSPTEEQLPQKCRSAWGQMRPRGLHGCSRARSPLGQINGGGAAERGIAQVAARTSFRSRPGASPVKFPGPPRLPEVRAVPGFNFRNVSAIQGDLPSCAGNGLQVLYFLSRRKQAPLKITPMESKQHEI